MRKTKKNNAASKKIIHLSLGKVLLECRATRLNSEQALHNAATSVSKPRKECLSRWGVNVAGSVFFSCASQSHGIFGSVIAAIYHNTLALNCAKLAPSGCNLPCCTFSPKSARRLRICANLISHIFFGNACYGKLGKAFRASETPLKGDANQSSKDLNINSSAWNAGWANRGIVHNPKRVEHLCEKKTCNPFRVQQHVPHQQPRMSQCFGILGY